MEMNALPDKDTENKIVDMVQQKKKRSRPDLSELQTPHCEPARKEGEWKQNFGNRLKDMKGFMK